MGTWIEIKDPSYPLFPLACRSLQWERGLKCSIFQQAISVCWSFPAMGTWIEMFSWRRKIGQPQRRSLQWERGLKYESIKLDGYTMPSRSLQWERGLKYSVVQTVKEDYEVVPCNGNVDWNSPCIYVFSWHFVVPCNGNVDWNIPRLWAAILPMRCSHAGTWIEIKA